MVGPSLWLKAEGQMVEPSPVAYEGQMVEPSPVLTSPVA